MLDIVYFSNVSNNTHRFVDKLDWPTGKIHRIPLKNVCEFEVFTSYVLICPSYGEANHGHVPPQVRRFLADKEYRSLCVGIIGAGNLNFGEEFGRAGDVLAHKLKVPLLYKFDLAGNEDDVKKVKNGLLKFGDAGCHNFVNNSKSALVA